MASKNAGSGWKCESKEVRAGSNGVLEQQSAGGELLAGDQRQCNNKSEFGEITILVKRSYLI